MKKTLNKEELHTAGNIFVVALFCFHEKSQCYSIGTEITFKSVSKEFSYP